MKNKKYYSRIGLLSDKLLIVFTVIGIAGILLSCISGGKDRLVSVGRPSVHEMKASDKAPETERLIKTQNTDIVRTIYVSATSETAWEPDPEEMRIIAKILYSECRGVESKTEQAAVVWCILNRCDSDDPYYPDTVLEVITQPMQFAYYSNVPVLKEFEDLARDVLIRHHREKSGESHSGRVLPEEYIFFFGDGKQNHFVKELHSSEHWNWSLPSPYEN